MLTFFSSTVSETEEVPIATHSLETWGLLYSSPLGIINDSLHGLPPLKALEN